MEKITIEELKKSYGKTDVLRGINWEIPAQTQWAIQGASGSGKSTLLHLMAGLDRPSSGNILIDNNSLKDFDDQRLAEYRNREVGIIFQFHYLLPTLNGLENILLPARLGDHPLGEVKKLALDLVQKMGVEHCLQKYPYEMSGGEQQRVNVVRALSLKPQIVLCDEPTGNLDSQNSQLVMSLIRQLVQEFGSTLIVVTHDSAVASLFPFQARMRDGMLLV